MAPRITQTHKSQVRDRIQTSQLLNRLQNNGLGKLARELTMGQIKSIEICLRKTLPDLSTTVHTGPDGGPITYRVETAIVDSSAKPNGAGLPALTHTLPV